MSHILESAELGYLNFCLQWGDEVDFNAFLTDLHRNPGAFSHVGTQIHKPFHLPGSCPYHSYPEGIPSFPVWSYLGRGMTSSKSLISHLPGERVRVEAESSLHPVLKTKPDAPASH